MCGKPGYPFIINIDGQAAAWKVNGQKEILPSYDRDGKTSHDPNAGEGIKYILEKKIQLRAGTHKVFLGFPNEDYFKELEIMFQEGKTYTLEYKPIYKYKTKPTRIPSFKKGIKEYEVYLNYLIIESTAYRISIIRHDTGPEGEVLLKDLIQTRKILNNAYNMDKNDFAKFF